MADPIPLSNATLLKGLMPVNPYTLVPVESLATSPTSSTGSASVLEWNSNSDSELFQMSSPASAPTLTAQPTSQSPPLSPFRATSSPVGSSRDGGPVVDRQYIIHWPDLASESSARVPPAPVSNISSSPVTVADIDNVPALNEHPEELNALIERMVISDLHDTVTKWQSEASNASPVECATQGDALSPQIPSKTPSPVTPEDTSMTSTVLGYVHYDYAKDNKGSSSVTTELPPLNRQLSFFDPPSPARSAEASIISIAEYFKRKASERATPSAVNDQQISTAAVTAEKRPASANSALSYFSPSVSPYPRQSTAQSSEYDCGPSSHDGLAQGLWDFSAQAETVAISRTSPSITGNDHGDSNSDVEEKHCSSPPADVESPSSSSGAHSPVLAYPYTNLTDSFRYFNRYMAPTSGPIFLGQPTTTQTSQPKVQCSSPININVPPTQADFTSINSVPSFFTPPELEFRTALKNTNSSAPDSSARAGTSAGNTDFAWHFNSHPPATLPRMPPSPPSAPVVGAAFQNNTSTATRKPRPPLPALPTVKPPMAPTPPFMFNEELPKPAEDVGTPFAKAFPSAWTCSYPPQPSLPPSSPSLTALLSDAEENRQQNTGRDSAVPVPPHPVLDNAQAQQNSQQDRWVPGKFPACIPSPFSDDSWDSPKVPTITPYNLFNGSINPQPPFNSPWRTTKPRPPVYGTNPMHSPVFGAGPYDSWMAPDAYPPPPSSPPLSNPISGLSPPHQRRLRFASPPSPAEFMYRPFWHVPPPLPSYVPPPLPARPSPPPPQIPMRDMSYQNYMYSSPAPVIPPAAPDSAHAGWYTTSTKYSFGDATIVFRVETTLFNVHRHFFERHSEYFRKLLSTYWFSGGNHVFLPEVKKVDFERLLSIFYPTDLTKPDITKLEGWTSILTLAQKWDMPQVRVLAIQNIGDHAWPMEKIIIAHKHKLRNPGPAWLLPAYKAICGRATPLTLHEAEQLDMETVVKIWEVQHEVKAMGGVRGQQEDEKIGELVKEKFGAFESVEAPAGVPLGPTMW